jgi:hypothetical protein
MLFEHTFEVRHLYFWNPLFLRREVCREKNVMEWWKRGFLYICDWLRMAWHWARRSWWGESLVWQRYSSFLHLYSVRECFILSASSLQTWFGCIWTFDRGRFAQMLPVQHADVPLNFWASSWKAKCVWRRSCKKDERRVLDITVWLRTA